MNAGKVFRALRENKHISRKELAKNSGLSLQTIIKIELDYTKPSAYTIFKLSSALGVEELELVKIFK